jgi:DNA-binding NarL/FixJ family response regulator
MDVMKRLLIVADHSFVMQSVRLALRQTTGLEVCGWVHGHDSVRGHLLEQQPDVVLVDDMQDRVDALERVREVASVLPDARLLFLTLSMDDDSLDEAFEAGADAALSKAVHPIALGTLLRETVRSNIVHRFRRTRPLDADCPLTSREIETLALAAQGYTNGRIARELWVTEQTVKFHLSNTYRKLGVANRTEASRYAYVNALVVPEEELAS